ncbi:MAG TPA: putative phage abortive infection protein [Humidesulfovibrio sp.]|uniref:putative phage abortive infection protein n=1 Tax=Humidesulfovibrio sp. TaxID=2910988 RepID=UPI002B945F9B|nr:putative phage abortive infection protein [Humidesulfovibrio sp.]HWR03876.1 putative phage abortive infection protein [Humidesulfovibrio sp.]
MGAAGGVSMKKSTLIFCGFGIVIIWAWIGTFISDLSKEVNIAEALEASGALFTALAFAAAGYAVWLQRSSIEMQRQELELQRQELKDTREELKGQRVQLELQTTALHSQAFEASFYRLIDTKESVFRAMENDSEVGKFTLEEIVNEMKNRSILAKIFDKMQNSMSSTEFYEGMTKLHRQDIKRYMRLVEIIMLKIDESPILSSKDKSDYFYVFKSGLSSLEAKLLVYECIIFAECSDIKNIVNRYAVFESLRSTYIHDEIKEGYGPTAFGYRACPEV